MSVTDKIKHVMELTTLQCLEPVQEYARYIDFALQCLGDIESKIAYEKEFAFQIVRQKLHDHELVRRLSPMPSDVFMRAMQEAKNLESQKKIPHIAMPKDTTEYLKYHLLATVFHLEQYTYAPHVDVREGDVFLDCGGCFGETSIWACRKGAALCYCFEPSQVQQGYLEKNIISHQYEEKIIPIAKAVAKERGTVYFQQDTNNHPASGICAKHEDAIAVEATDLDTWCAENNVKPDFIKMDLEGAELDALHGAKHIIQEYKPRLAISLYHKLSDMWTIPRLIKKLHPDYAFWCKKNAYLGEFILYARAQ